MGQAVGYIAFAALGALLGGLLGWLFAPGIFWAALIGGAMTLSAVRVGFVLLTVDDSQANE